MVLNFWEGEGLHIESSGALRKRPVLPRHPNPPVASGSLNRRPFPQYEPPWYLQKSSAFSQWLERRSTSNRLAADGRSTYSRSNYT